MAQQTAVEWLIEEIHKNMGVWIPQHIQEQAKAMEKEQIIKAWNNAYYIGGANGSNDWVNECELTDNAEYYYNETYNK
jgi:hypothetical protein